MVRSIIKAVDIAPYLSVIWNAAKNAPLKIEEIAPNSEREVWWYCSLHNNEWKTKVHQQVRNPKRGCLDCFYQGRSLSDKYPTLAKQWHPTKNTLTPNQVSASSEKEFWWQCDKGHEWEKSVHNRVGGNRVRGCPYCTPRNKQNIKASGKSLKNEHPEVALIFHPYKNTKSIDEISSGTNQKVWWLGKCGHEWENRVNHQVNNNTCSICLGRIALSGFNTLEITHPQLVKEWHPTKNQNKHPQDFTYGSDFNAYWLCSHNHEWDTKINHRTSGTGCPECVTPVSSFEKEINEWLETLSISYERNKRNIIAPYELDFFFPQKGIAIEFNGIYWHSEANGKTKNYHYNKWLACENKNIQLIQIWEDDWKRNPNLIKRMISHKLGVSSAQVIYARNTLFKPLDNIEAKNFYDENHIQGYVKSTYHYGLLHENKIVAAISYTKTQSKEIFNLTRFATSERVTGGFSKLLKQSIKDIKVKNPDTKEIITFSDNEYSNGKLYQNMNFKLTKSLPVDYKYIYQNKRIHKFNFRKSKIKTNPKLKYVEGLTEKELTTLNKIYKVWDSGKKKYSLNIQ